MTTDNQPQNTAAPAAPTTAPAASPQAAAAPAAGDEFAKLIEQFERETAPKPEAAKPAAPDQPQEAPGFQQKTPEQLAAELRREQTRDAAETDLRSQLEGVTKTLQGMEAQARIKADRDDFANVVKKANEELGEHLRFLPPDYAETFLRNEVLTNGILAEALRHRYDNKGALHRAEHEMERAFKKLERAARSLPDREATEAKEAVAAAMRGARSSAAPEAKAPNLSRMTTAESRKFVEENYGYSPNY